jgi:Delta3-Delta2-enoyl-CoA isomerase
VIDIEEADGVQIVTMRAGENRCNAEFVRAWESALDQVEAAAQPVVVTGAGKFFSTGLDLEWLSGDDPEVDGFFPAFHRLLGRLVAFPAATAAAINGHAFGAGAILAAAFDHRVMRGDRGYFCFPEIDLGLSMSDQFNALCHAKFARPSLLRAWTSGARFGGDDARALGFVDAVADEDGLVDAAAAMVRDRAGKDPSTMRALKTNLYGDALAVLTV